MRNISEDKLFNSIRCDLQQFKKSIQELSSFVSEWICSKNEKETTVFKITTQKTDFIYVLQKELRKRFSNNLMPLWTWVENNQVIIYFNKCISTYTIIDSILMIYIA